MKKVTVTCDFCGKQLARWLEVAASCNTIDETLNVSDLLQYMGTRYICKDCADKLYYTASEVKKTIGVPCKCEMFHRVNDERAVCWGTKDAEVVHCNGNTARCENIHRVSKFKRENKNG